VVLGKTSMALRQAAPRAIIPTHKEKAVVLKSAAVASSSTLVGPFPVASTGKEVVFSQVEGSWTAVVKETWGTFTREESLPVLCKGDVWAALHNLQGKAAIHTKRHIHILETHQPPWAPKVVYVGALGVRGGGNSSSISICTYPGWIYGGNNSDGEPDGEVRSGGHRFYRSNTNHWCVEIIPGVLGRITRADSSLTLSANDIRAIGRWHHHDCHAGWDDCYVPHTSGSTIIAQRERRQEDRRKRREEQRRRQEEERRIAKEAEDRAKQIYSARCKIQEELIRAEKRKQRLDEAYRREEERRQKEEARREEEEQVLVEQTMQNTSEATLTHDVTLEQGQEDRLCDHLEAIHVQSTLDQEVTQVQGVSSLSSGTPED
jgi:flagellar biosynthesis GTPase FlhF